MPYLEGVTTRGAGRNRHVDCNRCVHLNSERFCVCPQLVDPDYGPQKRRRTVDYCRYFKPKEES